MLQVILLYFLIGLAISCAMIAYRLERRRKQYDGQDLSTDLVVGAIWLPLLLIALFLLILKVGRLIAAGVKHLDMGMDP